MREFVVDEAYAFKGDQTVFMKVRTLLICGQSLGGAVALLLAETLLTSAVIGWRARLAALSTLLVTAKGRFRKPAA
ncbi:hypothetical protein ACLK1G_14050 [Pseudomonas sp. NR3]|uniref:hypothetical protein n=1 Tax=Pseudomonas sp. NR3 TaxID=3155978 RepID=UPI003B66BACB